MVKAGPAVDEFIEQLDPAAPARRRDHRRRQHPLQRHRAAHGLRGVEGAAVHRHGRVGRRRGGAQGPQHDARRQPLAWPLVKPIFQAIAAKVGPEGDIPCCEWVGPRGAGHYVKMVHNGIEYGDMQLICEAYWMLKQALGLDNDELYEVFAKWNQGELDSYLIEITRDIFSVKDDHGEGYLVDKILDTAGAKGTGKWMSQLALDLGVPSTLVTEAVYARSLVGHQGTPASAPASCWPVPRAPTRATARSSSSRSGRRSTPRRFAATRRASCRCGRAAAEHNWPLRFRADRAVVAGRLHHPRGVPGADQGGFRHRSGAREPAAGPVFHAGRRQGPAGLADVVATAVRAGHSHAGLLRGLGLLRRLSLARVCRPICCRRSATISAPTPTIAWIAKAFFTPTGYGCGSRRTNRRPMICRVGSSAASPTKNHTNVGVDHVQC